MLRRVEEREREREREEGMNEWMGRFLFSVCEDLEMGTWKLVSGNRMEYNVSEGMFDT